VSEAEQAVDRQAKIEADRLYRGQASMASGGRGFGAVAARSQAMQNLAMAQPQLAAEAAGAAGRVRAQEQSRREGMLAELFGQDLDLAMAEEQYKRQSARQGLFGTLAGIAGAVGGGYAGGIQGAQAGAGLGHGTGSAISELFR
jgi:hypothetical protein